MGWNGQHAENGGEFKVMGYFVDYYEPTQNIVIEFDEQHHNEPKVRQRDIRRQAEIINELKCNFIRIGEKEAEKWKEILERV